MTSKIVLLPIKVPHGKFCWGPNGACEHFDNEGGHATCDLNLGNVIHDENYNCKKPYTCLNLKRRGNE